MATGTDLIVINPPVVKVPGDGPVRNINPTGLRTLGMMLEGRFAQYRSDRVILEERWLRNLRQYLGYYDSDIELRMDPERSKAYPKITRVKCISTLARIMDLMFPSDDKNWTLTADPSGDMDIEDVMQAIKDQQALDNPPDPNAPPPDPTQPQPPQTGANAPPLTEDYVQAAVKALAEKRAAKAEGVIEAQLTELGGSQSYDYVQITNEVVASGILYGMGVSRGPYARETNTTTWKWDADKGVPVADTSVQVKPMIETLSVWDYYPDLSTKRFEDSDGHFTRKVVSKSQLRKLADRDDFFGDVIRSYISRVAGNGNYREQKFETELRTMGVSQNINTQKATTTTKFEIIIWHGMIDGNDLINAGVVVPDNKRSDEIEAEVWMLDNVIIKAVMNPWAELGLSVRTTHEFIFDKDDTAPTGFGLPNVMRDTQMAICSAARMMLDNASVVCGPILELNTALLRVDQDMSALTPWKIFYRDDESPQTTGNPAVREIKIDSHIDELMKIIDLYLKFADTETFVNPMTGGDMSKMPSEPMRNAAGASMLLGNAALPFKQIIRNFDKYTESVILSLVQFNQHFNPDKIGAAAYQVVARGASSLIAKEVRGMQIDFLSSNLTPEERLHVDERKLVEAKFKVRDFTDMLVPPQEYVRRKAAQDAAAAAAAQLTQSNTEATIRNLYAEAYKNMTQGQKNQVAANADAVAMAIDIMQKHGEAQEAAANAAGGGAQGAQGGTGAGNADAPGGPVVPNDQTIPPSAPGLGNGQDAGLLAGGPAPTPSPSAGM